MNAVWWRSHTRALPDLSVLSPFGDFVEVDRVMPFLAEALDPPAGGRLLDVGCAEGAYAIRLAQWGYRVTGIEVSDALLAHARQEAGYREVEVEFRRQEARELPERGAFDGALFLDFGAGTDAENAARMRTVVSALRPGGRIVFGTLNPYYWAQRPVTEHRSVEGVDVIHRYRFDFATGCLNSRVRCILAAGERRELPAARYRTYTLPELRSLADATGLSGLQVFGATQGDTHRLTRSPDMLATPSLLCVGSRPVGGEAGEGI